MNKNIIRISAILLASTIAAPTVTFADGKYMWRYQDEIISRTNSTDPTQPGGGDPTDPTDPEETVANFLSVNSADSETIARVTQLPAISISLQEKETGNAYLNKGASWTLNSGTLPPGITTQVSGDTGTLTLHGYPTDEGTFDNLTWKVTDATGKSITTSPISLTIAERAPLKLTATPSSSQTLNINADNASIAISASDTAFNRGIDPANWTVTGILPPGISWAREHGGVEFFGKATGSGTFENIIVSATDDAGDTETTTVRFVVTAPAFFAENVGETPQVVARVTQQPLLGTHLTNQQTLADYTGATWTLHSGTLPPGITPTFNGTKSLLTYVGYPTTEGLWENIVWNVKGTDGISVLTDPISIEVGPRLPLTVDTDRGDRRIVSINSEDVSINATASNRALNQAIPSNNWTVTGSLPTGVTYTRDSTGLHFKGKATSSGIFSAVITAKDTAGDTATLPFNFYVYGDNAAFKQLSLGQHHTCGVTVGGGVKCWGWNNNGQLGIGNTSNKTKPTQVVGLESGVKMVAAASTHSCALLNSGAVWCWGNNSYGQLGTGATGSAVTSPVLSSAAPSNLKEIMTGERHTCGITTNNEPLCWGNNSYGQIGDNTKTQRLTPTSPFGLTTGVKSLIPFAYSTCALLLDGSVKCWGTNNLGQLGDGTTSTRLIPTQALGLESGVTNLAGGGLSTAWGHACAIQKGVGLKCWGENGSGQLGIGNNNDTSTPTVVVGMANAMDVSVAVEHTCAIKSDNSLYCWGISSNGRIGNGSTASSNVPLPTSIGPVTSVTVGGDSSCATAITGTKCWGGNTYGALGDGSTTNRLSPVDLSN